MLLRMGDGQPRFEIRNSVTTELLLKVYGEQDRDAGAAGRQVVAGRRDRHRAASGSPPRASRGRATI